MDDRIAAYLRDVRKGSASDSVSASENRARRFLEEIGCSTTCVEGVKVLLAFTFGSEIAARAAGPAGVVDGAAAPVVLSPCPNNTASMGNDETPLGGSASTPTPLARDFGIRALRAIFSTTACGEVILTMRDALVRFLGACSTDPIRIATLELLRCGTFAEDINARQMARGALLSEVDGKPVFVDSILQCLQLGDMGVVSACVPVIADLAQDNARTIANAIQRTFPEWYAFREEAGMAAPSASSAALTRGGTTTLRVFSLWFDIAPVSQETLSLFREGSILNMLMHFLRSARDDPLLQLGILSLLSRVAVQQLPEDSTTRKARPKKASTSHGGVIDDHLAPAFVKSVLQELEVCVKESAFAQILAPGVLRWVVDMGHAIGTSLLWDPQGQFCSIVTNVSASLCNLCTFFVNDDGSASSATRAVAVEALFTLATLPLCFEALVAESGQFHDVMVRTVALGARAGTGSDFQVHTAVLHGIAVFLEAEHKLGARVVRRASDVQAICAFLGGRDIHDSGGNSASAVRGSASTTIGKLLSLIKLPFAEVRVAAFHALSSFTLHEWGLKWMEAEPGCFEFLLNREAALGDKANLEWRFYILQRVALHEAYKECRILPIVSGAPKGTSIRDRIATYVRNGIFFTELTSRVADPVDMVQ